ncbi:cbb3-type cytochrome c oxidase subunit II [Chlamydiia bacterium]|nr:cbb3-type cytochrome c oxidase subunit II [Chlamydiia bacterium]
MMRRFLHRLQSSIVVIIATIALIFSTALIVTVVIPQITSTQWRKPASDYQRQVYEIADNVTHMATIFPYGDVLQPVYRLKKGTIPCAYIESETLNIIAQPELQQYITKDGEDIILTSRLLVLQYPQNTTQYKAKDIADKLRRAASNKNRSIDVMQLVDLDRDELLCVSSSVDLERSWVTREKYIWANDDSKISDLDQENGLLYLPNPKAFTITKTKKGMVAFDPKGEMVGYNTLQSMNVGLISKHELIRLGEDIYRAEGCWYCHTDQTRTLIQDTVVNSNVYPAPPSKPSEYIYQKVTFPGTKRNGPDLSRVGIKKASRDWHKAHFWSPETKSKGSIMPPFRHFFDNDPRGTSPNTTGVPNVKFEAIYQYLMTKGTRISSPDQAWWEDKATPRIIDLISKEESRDE